MRIEGLKKFLVHWYGNSDFFKVVVKLGLCQKLRSIVFQMQVASLLEKPVRARGIKRLTADLEVDMVEDKLGSFICYESLHAL